VTATFSRPAAAPATPAPMAVQRRAPLRRWRPGLVALAVALVAVGGLVAAYAVTLVGTSRAYLAVARDVSQGAVLSGADLTVVRISADPALHPIPATDVDRVVGRHAATPLKAHTLLSAGHLTDEAFPGPGRSLVGLSLSQERLPAGRVTPGAAVTLVATATATATATVAPTAGSAGTPTGPPPTFDAVVVDMRDGIRDGTFLVNVAVSTQDAAPVAALAAANQLVIVLGEG